MAKNVAIAVTYLVKSRFNMMGSRDRQKQLWSYRVNLDKRVRSDHPLRKFNELLKLDFMWFLGYGLDDVIPNHSILSKARKRWGHEVFVSLFSRVVAQCGEHRT